MAKAKRDDGRSPRSDANRERVRGTERILRELAGKLISAQETERRRIARDLHDHLSQELGLMAIELQELMTTIPEHQGGLRTSLKRLWIRTTEIASDAHQIAHDLHPARLEALGLVATVKKLCSELAGRYRIQIEFRHDGTAVNLPDNVALCLYRIAQESLSNVVNHSGAAKAVVSLSASKSRVRLMVSDSGCGFDAAPATNGLGLIGMGERLRLVGGNLVIQSSPSSGTQVEAVVPLNGREPRLA